MAFITINVDASSLHKLSAEIARLRTRIPVAIAQGLNEGGDKVRTQVRRAMQEQTGLLRLKSITSRSSTARAFRVAPTHRPIFSPCLSTDDARSFCLSQAQKISCYAPR